MFLGTILMNAPKNNDQAAYQDQRENSPADFEGLWVNEDQKKPGITRCKIAFKENRYQVQMWGSCIPQDCDWGKNQTDEIEKGTTKFELLWDAGFAESVITYEIVDGKLKLINHRRFKNGSARPDYMLVEYFVKN